MIFFTNFLALIIQAEFADQNSSSSAVYSALLIMVHVMFVLTICWNSWATMRATFSRRHVQVRPRMIHTHICPWFTCFCHKCRWACQLTLGSTVSATVAHSLVAMHRWGCSGSGRAPENGRANTILGAETGLGTHSFALSGQRGYAPDTQGQRCHNGPPFGVPVFEVARGHSRE